MKEGWEVKDLGDVCDVQRGLTYSGKDAVDYSKIVVLRATNINLETGLLDLSELKYLRNDFIIKENYLLKKGSLLICFSSGSKNHLGKVALVDRDYDAAFGGFIGQITPTEQVHSKYLFYNMVSENYRSYISDLTDGLNINNLKSNDLKAFKIPIPPLSEQEEIVKILDKTFAAIDQAKANIEQNIANAKELFQSKLNQIFSQKGEGWVEKSLGEVCTLFQGLAINARTKHLLVENSSLPLIRIKDLKNNTAEQFVSEAGYPENALVGPKDIIYTRTGSLGLVFRNRTGVLHNNSFKVVPNKELSGDYFFWWLQHDAFRTIIIGLASRAAQPDITHKLFKLQLISIPSLKQQAEYFRQIDALSAKTRALESHYQTKLISLEELKKSILQKAFAGELT